MAPKSRFTRLDAFTKTVDEARIRTTSGGVVTIISLLVVLWLAWSEWVEYRTIVVRPELIVDKGRGERMEIHLNVSFPYMPCELLTLDVMDVSGEQQHGVMHGIKKVRLSPAEEGGAALESESIDLHQPAVHLDPNYCGGCYGASPPPTAVKPGCCNSCDEVREAYAGMSWAFGRGEGVEQCLREHYAERLDSQRKEGCRIEGALRVNKVVGNFHFAPGRSFSNGNMHVHDLENYLSSPVKHRFSHTIHNLRFGPQLPEALVKRLLAKSGAAAVMHSPVSAAASGMMFHKDPKVASTSMDPLDGVTQETDDMNFEFMYFVKIVPTSYLPVGWQPGRHNNEDSIETKKRKKLASSGLGYAIGSAGTAAQDTIFALGGLGLEGDGSIESNQYSVTSHRRSMWGGDDADEGHGERLHSRGGIPGVFFSYDISPMKVINREERAKSFTGFLSGLCAIIGGTLTVAAAIDRGFYEGAARLRKMRGKEL